MRNNPGVPNPVHKITAITHCEEILTEYKVNYFLNKTFRKLKRNFKRNISENMRIHVNSLKFILIGLVEFKEDNQKKRKTQIRKEALK